MERRGRLKQRISQIFRGSLRSSCGISTRDVAEAVQEPVLVSRRYNVGDDDVFQDLGRSLSLPPPSREPLFHRHRHEMAAGSPRRLTVDCRCRPTGMTRESMKKAKKKERRVSEIGAFYEAGGDGEGRTCPPASPVSPSYYCFKQMKEELEREEKRIAAKKKKEKEKEGRKGKKLLSNSYGFTSSSSEDSDHDDVGNFFTSDEGLGWAPREGTLLKEREGETDVLFSSRSFSSDSSEFYYHSSRRHSRTKKKSSSRPQQKARRGDGGRSRHNARGDGFRPLVPISSSSSSSCSRVNEAAAAPEVELRREGFAVEKQSSDPYADFSSSMLEMIVEKQIFGARELEHLLHCYLSLNSPCHHPLILQVFSEICETLFSN